MPMIQAWGGGEGSGHPDAITVDGNGGLSISNTTLKGLDTDWLATKHPYDGTNIVEIIVKVPKGIKTIADDAFNKKTPPGYVIVGVDFSEASDLTQIGSQAFMGNSFIDGVVAFPSSLTDMDKSVFRNCENLKGVILPKNLKTLGTEDAGSDFAGCTSLEFVRVEGDEESVKFHLPDTLTLMGNQTFDSCSSLEASVAVIPSSVSFVGSECFDCPKIDTIVVTAKDVSDYNGGAFKNNNSGSNIAYGVGSRIVIFEDYDAWQTFKPSGSKAYGKAMTYEYTLHFGQSDTVGVKRLYNTTVNTVLGEGEYEWYVDGNYVIPKPDPDSYPDTPYGYRPYNWLYDNAVLTTSVKLVPSGQELWLGPGYELLPPEIEFIVDGEVVSADKITLSGSTITVNLTLSDKESYEIGVEVHHVLEDVPDSGRLFKYEYEWIDRQGSSNGPRKDDDGFGRYKLFGNNDVTNTIVVDGKDHERTGDNAYRVVVYGKSAERGGQYLQFYQSANPIIGVSEGKVTDHVIYEFQVSITDPAIAPDMDDIEVEADYGYESAQAVVDFIETSGHSYSYQLIGTDGNVIFSSIIGRLDLPRGLSVDTYYYTLKVTATKDDNGDTATSECQVTFNVVKAKVIVTPDGNQSKYYGQKDSAITYMLSKEIEVSGSLARVEGENVGQYAILIGSLAPVDVNYELELLSNASFEVRKYAVTPELTPGSPDGDDGWYVTIPTLSLDGHSFSLDGGATWSKGPIAIGDMDGTVMVHIRSDLDNATNGAICILELELKVDTVVPVVTGIEDGGVHCIEAGFATSDSNGVIVTVDDSAVEASEGHYMLEPGIHAVTVRDPAGNSVELTVTVNEGHTFGDWVVIRGPTSDEDGLAERGCVLCGARELAAIPATGDGGYPPWGIDEDDSWVPPNIVVEKSGNDYLWIFVVMGSVATFLFLLFAYFERRDRARSDRPDP